MDHNDSADRIEGLAQLVVGALRATKVPELVDLHPDLPDLAASAVAALRRELDGVELDMLGVSPDPADLDTAGILAPTPDDVDAVADAMEVAPYGTRQSRTRAGLDVFARRLADRLPQAANPLRTDDGQPGRLVIRPADVEAAARHYHDAAGETVDSDGMRAALESYAERIRLGLATGTTAAGRQVTDVSGPYIRALHDWRSDETTYDRHLRAIRAVLEGDAANIPGHPGVGPGDVAAAWAAYQRAAAEYDGDDDSYEAGPRMAAGLRAALETWRGIVLPAPTETAAGRTGPDPDCPDCHGGGAVPAGPDGEGDYCHCVRFGSGVPVAISDKAPF